MSLETGLFWMAVRHEITANHREIWLFRHGETSWSADERTGRTDVPLSGVGRQRARAIGKRLAGRDFGMVLSNPLTRAEETCRLAGYGDVVEHSDDLME